MSLLKLACFCVLGALVSGCTTAKNLHERQKKAQREYHDEWSVVGKEGRSEFPREKETDALTPWLESPEARAINKNLGYD